MYLLLSFVGPLQCRKEVWGGGDEGFVAIWKLTSQFTTKWHGKPDKWDEPLKLHMGVDRYGRNI